MKNATERAEEAYRFGQQIAKNNWQLAEFRKKYKDDKLQKRMYLGYLDEKAKQLKER